MAWNGAGLADLFAVAAAELLSHRLDHFPLTRHRFQRPGHVFTDFAQAIAAAALATRRRIDHHPLAWEMLGERLALGALARKSPHCGRLGDGLFRRQFVFRGVGFQLFERQRQLLDQPRRTLRPLPVDLALELGDPKLLLDDQRTVFRRLRAGNRKLGRNLESLGALDRQGLLLGCDIIRTSVAISIHAMQ